MYPHFTFFKRPSSRRDHTKRLNTQLLGFAKLTSRKAQNHFTNAPDIINQIIHRWRRNVISRRNENESHEKVYSVFCQYKLFTRLFNSWKIQAVRQSEIDSKQLTITDLETRHYSELADVCSQRDSLQSELESVRSHLSEEIKKRESIQIDLKKFFVSKFENLSVEAVEVIDGGNVEVPDPPLLPFVNYSAPNLDKNHVIKRPLKLRN